MLFGNRRPRTSDARRRSLDFHRPRGEQLEDRLLPSVDLGGVGAGSNPVIATAPFGMAFAGATAGGGAGWSVSDLGDTNGDGYDDFMIGAPTVSSPSTLGTGINGEAFLVFGSKTVNVATVTDWIGKTAAGTFQYTATDRVGNLAQLGAAAQTNPITGATNTFPFAGITFVTAGGNIASGLGASVASVRLASGNYGILIGAPFGTDVNNANIGTGRAYLISGSLNNHIGQTINLDTPTLYTDLSIVTFVNNATGGQLGYSVAGGSNIFGDGASDIILGAPNATFGSPTGTGAVYALSTGLLSGATQTINVATIGQSGTQSAIFTGASSGAQAGWSVADGGDVNGVTSGGTNVDDLLIGAPSQGGTGVAYLIYGGSTLAGRAQTVNGLRFINMANVGASSTTTGAVPGAVIVGTSGSKTGWSVSSGGDFNSDGFGDILIGSPGFSSSTTITGNGLATLFYGAASSSAGFLTGVISLASPPTGIVPLLLTGATSGSMAGYAVSPVGFINSGQPSLILVGSPGFNNNAGTAYLIPGRVGGLTGAQSLASAESAPLSGVQFLLSTPGAPSTSPPFFGASVSSRFQTTRFTADSDSKADFIVGAPGYDVTQNATLNLAGGAMIVQGGLITVPTPATNVITTTIGVGTPFAPFTISATTPANLQIWVFGLTSPSFHPVTDINATTVTVDGIAFPGATLTPDPNTADFVNGIQPAIITITPRSSLGLTAGTHTITISGRTLATSPVANATWTGSASVTVTGSATGGGGGTALSAVAAGGPVLETTFNSPFGPTQYVPTISQLSAYNYAPIPLSVALQQYQPAPGFNERIYGFNHPGKHLRNFLSIRGPSLSATGIWGEKEPRLLINDHVYNRSRFHPNSTHTYTHKAPNIQSIYKGVVPTQLTTQSASFLGPVYKDSYRDIGSKVTPGLPGGSKFGSKIGISIP